MSTPKSNNWIVFNGGLYQDLPHDFYIDNRAFRLGDGFFETIRVIHGRIFRWEAHYARIVACCKALQIEIPPVFTSDFMLSAMYKVMEKNAITGGGKIRITFFREGSGTYRPESNRLGFVMEATAHHPNEYMVKDQGLNVEIYTEMRKTPSPLSLFKIMGNHVYIQASVWAVANNYHDALILNHENHIIEATSSNIFVVKNTALYTPSLRSGCVGGVMRMSVINAALRLGIQVYESDLDVNDITYADEVFLTNAISGIAWVSSFRNKRYYHKLSDKLVGKLNRIESIDA